MGQFSTNMKEIKALILQKMRRYHPEQKKYNHTRSAQKVEEAEFKKMCQKNPPLFSKKLDGNFFLNYLLFG